MKSGFSGTLDGILKRHGMATSGILGTVVGGKKTREALINMGYRVESGLAKSNYDFIFISSSFSRLGYIRNSLTKIGNGCIIIFRIDSSTTKLCLCDIDKLGHKFDLFEFAPNKFFGVIVKGLLDESHT